MMSRALDNRSPPLESGLEYSPHIPNTFRDEDWGEDDRGEQRGDEKGELGVVIDRQARRAMSYTPATARRTPLTDITDLDTDEQDVAESTMSSHINLDFL